MAPDLVLDRPDQFHALADPTRMRILGALAEAPASVQRLSKRLSVPKGTVAHHVKVLERAGLIRLGEARRVRGIEEKQYTRTPGRFRISEARGESPSDQRRGLANYALRHALAEARPPSGADDPSTSVIVRARMPAERARRFARLLDDLSREFLDGAPGEGETFGFVAAVYVPDWADEPDAGGQEGRA
jgi:DNA-binding transcriptional ArsR family regulator